MRRNVNLAAAIGRDDQHRLERGVPGKELENTGVVAADAAAVADIHRRTGGRGPVTTTPRTVDHDDLVANAVLLLQAGHDTTMNTLTSGGYTPLKQPEQLARLRADLTLVSLAVEEMLRYKSAIGIAPRTARENLELAEGTRHAGSTIPFLGAINRDPKVFDQPDRVDVATRADNPHLAFGAGPHLCAGAALARLELQMGFTAILRRLPALRLAGEPRWTSVENSEASTG
jgi:cytochrome P450